jgi:hypothetical protein
VRSQRCQATADKQILAGAGGVPPTSDNNGSGRGDGDGDGVISLCLGALHLAGVQPVMMVWLPLRVGLRKRGHAVVLLAFAL